MRRALVIVTVALMATLTTMAQAMERDHFKPKVRNDSLSSNIYLIQQLEDQRKVDPASQFSINLDNSSSNDAQLNASQYQGDVLNNTDVNLDVAVSNENSAKNFNHNDNDLSQSQDQSQDQDQDQAQSQDQSQGQFQIQGQNQDQSQPNHDQGHDGKHSSKGEHHRKYGNGR